MIIFSFLNPDQFPSSDHHMILQIVAPAHTKWVCVAGIRRGCYLNCHCCRNKHSNYSLRASDYCHHHCNLCSFKELTIERQPGIPLALTPQPKFPATFVCLDFVSAASSFRMVSLLQGVPCKWKVFNLPPQTSQKVIGLITTKTKLSRAIQATNQTSANLD